MPVSLNHTPNGPDSSEQGDLNVIMRTRYHVCRDQFAYTPSGFGSRLRGCHYGANVSANQDGYKASPDALFTHKAYIRHLDHGVGRMYACG